MAITRNEKTRKPSTTKPRQPPTRPPMPPKDFQKCLRRIVCPKVHGHANHCLDGFGLKGTGINPSAKPKTPLGWEFVVLERNLAAERGDILNSLRKGPGLVDGKTGRSCHGGCLWKELKKLWKLWPLDFWWLL